MTLTAAERVQLLSASEIECTFRIQLLDPDLEVVTDDIAERVVQLEVEHHSYGDIQRLVRITTDLPLEWGFHHVRPWVTVSGDGLTDEQLMGTFALTSTPQSRATPVPEFPVQGYDLIYRLKQPVDTSWTAPRDRTYLQSVADICAQQGLEFRTPPGPTDSPNVPRSWTITDSVTWLDIANELLAAVGFQPLATDRWGVGFSEPYIQPEVKSIAWHYDATTMHSDVVADDGEVEHEYTQAPNRWVAYRIDVEGGPPVDGNGIARVDNVTDGPTSQQRRRLVIPRVEQVDAVDQPSLLSAALMMRDEDGFIPRILRLITKPNIWHDHLDVVTVLDPRTETNGRMAQVTWLLRIDATGADTNHELREVS